MLTVLPLTFRLVCNNDVLHVKAEYQYETIAGIVFLFSVNMFKYKV